MHEPPAFSTSSRSRKVVTVIILVLICLALSYLVARGSRGMGKAPGFPHMSKLLH